MLLYNSKESIIDRNRKKITTYNDLQEVVGLPRGPVFPGHLCSASKDRLRAGLKTR